ncbi:2'-5' RNA ligase family protein [Sphingomonas nostoxanthinifaciens]|uniref:2'-5' RNA ligase family protein n=1 Tax=Sphingomonas nostoxanthinifaciens TaxID=2872652 RepID=UPI001CC1F7DF|nr:2'-5' RNA ligase family protein [Sphingomonas nostoxanthinifaciens]UAK24404.1 2'-5' RNA ligase family protein [Sphingomonas nostoxanthinifaciens]
MAGTVTARILYVMTKPPHDVADRIAAHPRCDRTRSAGLLHMTVQPILDLMAIPRELRAHVRDRAITRCGAVEGEPFSISFDRTVESARTIGLRGRGVAAGAKALQRAICCAFGRWPLPDYGFNPHVTIAYRPDGKGSVPLDAIHWEVRDIRLIESLVGIGRHEELGRWPLRRQPGLFD